MHVLMVCSANVFRSPLAEHFFRNEADHYGLPWTVTSAGVSARDGDEMHPRVGKILRSHGIAVDAWRSRRLHSADFAAADLILTADESNRGAVVTLDPHALTKTFLLQQFARYVQGVDFAALTSSPPTSGDLLAAIGEARTHMQPVSSEVESITDPAGRSRHRLRLCATAIERAVRSIVLAASGVPAVFRSSRYSGH